MSLKVGIVGLPNVGKSTLFKALTKQSVEIANYPFATINPNVGVVEVPDERVQKLAQLSKSKKIISAVIEFADIAGLVKGAAAGEGLGNKFLSHIREVDAIAEVVRVFPENEIIHVSGKPDPVSDIKIVEYELILKDIETVENRLKGVESEVRAGKKGASEEKDILQQILAFLKSGNMAGEIRNTARPEIIDPILSQLNFFTDKPFIYVFNISEEQLAENWQPDENILKMIKGSPFITLSAKIEAELADLSDDERKEYLSSLRLKLSGLEKFISASYRALKLTTFFTTGEDETRAWTIPKNSTVPRAGRAIHSDFENRFIRAEVLPYVFLLQEGSWIAAREKGEVKTVGKDYIVQDGDVIIFKI